MEHIEPCWTAICVNGCGDSAIVTATYLTDGYCHVFNCLSLECVIHYSLYVLYVLITLFNELDLIKGT